MTVGGRCVATLTKGPASGTFSIACTNIFINLEKYHEFVNVAQFPRKCISYKFNLRGERCKFKHPADKKEGEEKIPFCNDYRQVVQ